MFKQSRIYVKNRRISPSFFLSLSVLVTFLTQTTSDSLEKRQQVRYFPNGFLFGSSTASYQVEGAWNEDGRTPSIWDTISHARPCLISECHNGDVAADTYHLYKRDVEMMRELNLDFYRLSISWSRLLPTSFPDNINEKAVEFYRNWLDEIHKYNIEPMVTLYHWDLPQKLQDMGGWTNPYIIDWFVDYARVVFEQFGDQVNMWLTFNEPREICHQGYGSGTMAPLLKIPGVAEYICAKNLLLAHAKTYHMYDKEFRSLKRGTIGISFSASCNEPESQEHAEAAEDSAAFEWGIYAHPIFSETGDYPQVIKEKVAAKSAAQGFPRSRLPELSPEEIDLIKGTSDFFGLNHYSTNFIYRNESVYNMYDAPSLYDDQDIAIYKLAEWKSSAADWLKEVPWGFYKLLTYIREKYNNPPVYVTENGFTTTGGMEDNDRIEYFLNYLDALLDALEEGSDIRGYAAWSLMDNFEWLKGYTHKFGLYAVDFESPERTRTPRKSAFILKEIARTHKLNPNYEPDTTAMTISTKDIQDYDSCIHCKRCMQFLQPGIIVLFVEVDQT
ncbi:myrosinase 1-like [Hyposmocoma kahamanoa]|uniref:myrosinase 1-like n=1 Tax=Hyposmocoma kahamanoa TaxID=1477025 RepID=UPI000E6D9C25|nr:myrosinase 1-like [Hyposmocoma kahamanoa]